jgi:hypothetical protein
MTRSGSYGLFVRSTFGTFLFVAALAAFASDRAWAPTMMEYGILLGPNGGSCRVVEVVDGKVERRPDEKMISGLFASREAATEAMTRTPECLKSRQ